MLDQAFSVEERLDVAAMASVGFFDVSVRVELKLCQDVDCVFVILPNVSVHGRFAVQHVTACGAVE